MTTAQNIEPKYLSGVSTGPVAMTAQDNSSQKVDISKSHGFSTTANKRVALTSTSPVLKNDAQSDLNSLASSAIALLAEAENGSQMSSKELAQKIQAILSQLSAAISKDFPNADPKAKALFNSLAKMLGDSIADPSGLNPEKAVQHLRAMLSDLEGMLEKSLSASAKAVVAPMLEELFKSVDSSLATQGADTQPATPPTPESEKNSLIATLIKMIQLILGLQLALSNNQATQSKVESAISKASLAVMTKAFDDQLKKIAEIHKKIEAQKHANFWEKIGMDILGGLAVLAAFIFLGPVAGVIAGTLFVMQVTGATQKMFAEIHSPVGRFFAELAFAVAVAAIGGGLSGLVDGALASTAEVASAGVESAAGSAVTEGAEIEMTTMGKQAVEDVVDEGVESAASKTESVSPKEAALKSFKSTSFNSGLQTLMSTSAISDLATSIFPHDKKAAMWLTVALSILVAFAAMGGAAKMSGGSFTMTDALPSAAENSKAWGAVNSLVKMLQNPFIIGTLTAGAQGTESYFGVKKGQAEIKQGELLKEQGPIEALYTLAKMLADSNTLQIKTQGDFNQKLIKGLQASLERTDELTLPTAVAARVLA
jgi:ElaB/YqjD/DUF883 family membrane-anchored ribosome-binding protein